MFFFIYRYCFPDSSVGKESTCNAGDSGSIPGSGRSTGEGRGYPLQYSWASLVTQLVKNPLAMWETWVDPWVGKTSWRRERLLTPVFWPGDFYGLYSPWGHKELDMTEWLSFSLYIKTKGYWRGLLFPPRWHLPSPGIEHVSPAPPALQVDSLLLSHRRSSVYIHAHL